MTANASLIHHEDLVVGEARAFGRHTITKDEIIAYAREFDPQPMHLDEAAAAKSLVGGLCAAGYQTCALMMRIMYDGFIVDLASEGSPGIEETKWLKPVRPGDTLSVRLTVIEKRDLASRPNVGMSRIHYQLLNQAGDVVMSMIGKAMTRRRKPAAVVAPSRDTAPAAKRALIASLWDLPPSPGDPHAHFFEDRQIGDLADLGGHLFTAEEIIRFARRYDPQPFHMDAVAAKASLFGALCASGWHTCAIYIRQIVMQRQAQEAVIRAAGKPLAAYGPSPGFKDLLWLRPVFAGDRIEFMSRISGKVDLKSRPERGLLISQAQGRNQRGELVYSTTGQIFVERRARFVATA